MKEVKTQKRYKCDFCKKRGIKRKMEFHEINCYRNPNRVCSTCNNTGKYDQETGADSPAYIEADCPYCKAFSKEKIVEIEKYEAEHRKIEYDNEPNIITPTF